MSDLSEQIETTAASPKKASTGDQSVESQSLTELIEADRHLAAKTASNSPSFGLRFAKMVPPGAG